MRKSEIADRKRIKLDWWTRKALTLLKDDHVFVVTYHHCPFAWGVTFVRKYGIYSIRTGMRVWGFERTTFSKVRRWLDKPFSVPMIHEPCPLYRRRESPPDRVYSLKRRHFPSINIQS